jgi:integrase
MPRKKPLPKYVTVKGGKWYVRKKIDRVKHPIWRICRDQTQAGVDAVLARIDRAFAEALQESEQTLNLFLDRWLDDIEDTIQPRTYQDYSAILARYIRPSLGELAIAQLAHRDMQAVFQGMKKRGLSPRTRKYLFTVVNAALKKAVEWKLIEKNPATGLTMPRGSKNEKRPLTREEARTFFAACASAPRGIFFEFALETGMRPEEYLALRWTDIDLDGCTASVSRALVFNTKGGSYYFGPPKTRNSYRSVKFSRRLGDRLILHREDQLVNENELGLVFPSTTFTPMSSSNLGKRYLKPLLARLGLSSDYNLYTLRHTAATLLLGKVNPKIVAERLGSSVEMILKTYSHVMPDMQEAAAAEIEEALYEPETVHTGSTIIYQAPLPAQIPGRTRPRAAQTGRGEVLRVLS